jgi:hypothetical protein
VHFHLHHYWGGEGDGGRVHFVKRCGSDRCTVLRVT